MNTTTRLASALCATSLLLLSACGGGTGSGIDAASSVTVQAAPVTLSSGSITAFGSVFVNGHEFGTGSAVVIDDDAATTTASLTALEVGRSVDVKPFAVSAGASAPSASEIHLHPLVRGVVDASDLTAASLVVMGQTVMSTASTLYSDHRACVTATPAACTAVTGQADLAATTGSGSSATPGSYVTVDGYLYTSGTSNSVVATLVSVSDLPSGTAAVAAFKVEGPITAVSGSNLTIGALTVGLAGASCHVTGAASTACASAYSVGQVVSAFAAAAPALPAASFSATAARLVSRLPVETAGASVEFEGKVSSTTVSPASIVVRGVTVDLSALATPVMPAVGDVVKVQGTLASNGTTVTASAVAVTQVAISALLGLEGDTGAATAGATSGTYTLSVLGKTITVNAKTRLADRSIARGASGGAGAFNVNTVATYLAASASHHVIVLAAADSTRALTALSLTIIPASMVAGVAGTVDSSPLPVNSSVSATPTTFSVHGIAVSAASTAIIKRKGVAATVAAGDAVIVRGSYGSGLTVAAPVSASTLQVNAANVVVDLGARPAGDQGGF